MLFRSVLFISIAGSYAVMIRTLHVARKEEKTNFFSDVFGEGMKHGFSCAWGIFKKIWYWILLMIVGYIVMFAGLLPYILMGVADIFTVPFAGTDSLADIFSSIMGNMNPGLAIALIVVGFALTIFAAIKMMVASYKYFLVTYLKHDYPDKSTNELLENSKEMMDENKAKAFVIPFTFIGWLILSAICIGIVSYIFEVIWPPEVTWLGTSISTMPTWATILLQVIIYFIISFVTAYMQMTYAEFYLERNPLEIYNEDYVKPETNAKKYKKIIGWVCGIIVVIYIAIIAIGGILFDRASSMTYDMSDMLNQFEQGYNISD